jgi:hypothetical protein
MILNSKKNSLIEKLKEIKEFWQSQGKIDKLWVVLRIISLVSV